MLVETESISPTSREYSGACRQNYEETSSTEDQDNMQDQDIVQEHIQERMEPENKINSCKLYIKESGKYGSRRNNCNFRTLLHAKNYIEN